MQVVKDGLFLKLKAVKKFQQANATAIRLCCTWIPPKGFKVNHYIDISYLWLIINDPEPPNFDFLPLLEAKAIIAF